MTSLLMALLMAIQQNAILTIPPVEASELSVDELKTIAVANAEKYNLNSTHLLAVINCESGWDVTKQSDFYKNGKREQSFGLAQINLPSHRDVSYDEAVDPYFALNFIAQQWSENNEALWTCWDILYGKK